MSTPPPADTSTAERFVVAGMMTGPFEDVLAAAGRLTVECFSLPLHAVLFDALCGLRAREEPTDAASVLRELHRLAQMDGAHEAYGAEALKLHEWASNTPVPGSVGYWAGVVLAAAKDRRRRAVLDTAPPKLAAGEEPAAVAAWVGAELVKVDAMGDGGRRGPAVDEEAFWTAREELKQIRAFARARMASPWAVLGVVLVRLLSQVPPQIVLPATIGTHASLNLFIGIVAPSGLGKGAAEAAAGEAVDVGDVLTYGPGSGEGIAHLYAHREGDEVVMDETSVVFSVPEVDTQAALRGRQGSTLLPELRKAWTGEDLGFAYVDRSKRLPLKRHTYRFGMVVGIQPGRAGALLDDVDGGTPQRFVWLPGTDPGMPEETPGAPEPASWKLPPGADYRTPGGRLDLPVSAVAVQAIRAEHRRRHRGETDALDGHAMLCRLKVAAALALLAERHEVTADDWTKAGAVMAVSDRTRAAVVDGLRQAAAAQNRARAELDAARMTVIADRTESADLTRAIAAILRRMDRDPSEIAHAELRKSMSSRTREHFDDAVAALIERRQISVEEREYQGQPGRWYSRVQ